MKKQTLVVIAGHLDRPVPIPSGGGGKVKLKTITTVPTTVPNDRYFRRRIIKGDLVLAPEQKIKMSAPATGIKKEKK